MKIKINMNEEYELISIIFSTVIQINYVLLKIYLHKFKYVIKITLDIKQSMLQKQK